jgi:hypothetical protein
VTTMAPEAQVTQAAERPRPQVFRVGVYETDTPDIDVSLLQSTSAVQKLGTFKLSPNGWLAGIWCMVQMVTSANAAAVTFTGDNPFSSINKVTFKDVGQREVVGPLTGYEWFTINKWGGYFAGNPDPRNPANGFFATAGAVGTGGSFTFHLWLPLEIVYRDTLGEIENKSSSSAYTLEVFLDTTANTYGVAPTTPGTMRFRANLYGYTEPEAADMRGRPLSQAPPADGAVQYWTSEVPAAQSAGIGKYNIQGGIGYSIRNIVFIAYDNGNGTRATGWNFGTEAGDWPDPATLSFGKVQLLQRPAIMWQNLMARWYGLTAAGPDAALAPENGVFVQAFNREFDTIAGSELRNGLLVTKAGNVLQLSGSFGGAAIVHYLVNYIVPPGNDPARLRSR